MDLIQKPTKSSKQEQIDKALAWIDLKLSEPDLEGFYIAPATYKGLHHTLRVYKNELINRKGFVQDNAYYQVRKIKKFLENEHIKRIMEF